MAKAVDEKDEKKLNNDEVKDQKDQTPVPAPKPDDGKEAEPDTGNQIPNPFKAIGAKIKGHWKGILIGAGAAAGAALLAYMKGRDSVIETLEYDDDEEDEEDDSVVDVEATEVEEGD